MSDKNKKILSFNENKIYSNVPAVISLSALFPKAIMETWINCTSNPSTNIRNFIEYLLPERYRLINFANKKYDLIQCNDSILLCFWNGNTNNDYRYDSLYVSIAENLLNDAPVYIADLHSVIDELQSKLSKINENMPADLLRAYKSEIYDLCVTIVNERNKFSGFSSVDFCKAFPILDEDSDNTCESFIVTLSHLVIIASTSSIWCKKENNNTIESERKGAKIFPCVSINHTKFEYCDGFIDLPRISWATLFPEQLRNMVVEKSNLEQIDTTKQWFCLFIPDKLQENNGKSYEITNKSLQTFSHHWNSKNEGNKACKIIAENLIREGKKLSNEFDALLEHITQQCYFFLSNLEPSYLRSYQSDIDFLFSKIQKNSGSLLRIEKLEVTTITNIKESLANNLGAVQTSRSDYSENNELINVLAQKLSLLVLISATWTIWINPKNDKTAKELSLILFSPKNDLTQKDSRQNIIKEANIEATKMLSQAEESFHNHEIEKCGDLCRNIISSGFVDDSILGDAYYYLVRCHDEFSYCYKGYYNSKEFKSRALSYGSKCARKDKKWSISRLDSLLYLPAQEEKNPNFQIITNTSRSDYHMDIFLRSFNTSTEKVPVTTYIQNNEQWGAHIKPFLNTLILLIDDNQEKNYLDLLLILDTIRIWNSEERKAQHSVKNAWTKHRIYIRLDEEKYASLIDTALKHMDNITIPVLLIDDNKIAAQYLLSRFPLFYPIRALSAEELSSNRTCINLNIISEHDDALTNWIIREAYWLGCFHYRGINLQINVISPEASSIESRLNYTCPKIMFEHPDYDKTSKVTWDFSCTLKQLESSALFDYLNEKTKNCYNYYVVNCASDISSLNLAIKIREWNTRNIVQSQLAIKTAHIPVITYHCENMDISHMAENLIVHQAEYGDNWYNNYSIIPFNSSHHYQLSEIDGGYFEKLSQSIHLQYCGCSTQATKEEKSEFLEDYFTRCYNRDSSMAVALSIPYRLFQMATQKTDHIMPVGWVLKNTEAYSNQISLNAMASQASEYKNPIEMLNYERARWMRYMISRGWQSASSEDTIKFIEAGNPGRQLYIGLLHGCICSQKDVTKLQEELYNSYRYKFNNDVDERFAGNDPRIIEKDKKKSLVFDKYLQYDIRSLKQTSDIISTAWFPEAESIPTYFIDEDR